MYICTEKRNSYDTYMKHFLVTIKRCILLLCVASCCLSAQAQFCRLFDSDYDLPNTLLNDVVVDTDQMVWVATEDGLYRYDGSKFSTYKRVPGDPHSLQENYVRCLFVDRDGHLLIGSRAGLQIYRPETDDFTEVACLPGQTTSTGDIARIYQRRDGEIWMTGNASVCLRIDENGIPSLYPNALTETVDFTEHITEDMDGRIWVTKGVGDMFRLEKSGEIRRIHYDNPEHSFYVLFTASDGNLYASGQRQGLYRYNRNTDAFERLGKEEDATYQVRDMCNVGRDEMLVGTDNAGLRIFSFKTETFRPYVFNSGRMDPLTQKVHSVCIDNDNSIWLALYQKGLMYIPHEQRPFRYIGYNSYQSNSIGDKCVTAIVQSDKDQYWIATDNGGLHVINSTGQSVRHFPYTGKPGTIPSSLVALYRDNRGRFWFGSYTQGFGQVDSHTGQCTFCTIEGEDATHSSMFCFEQDHQGRIWSGSMGSGIYLYDEVRKTMTLAVDTSFCHWTNDIHFDPVRNVLYAGTHNGLAIIDADDPDYAAINFLPDHIVFSITTYDANSLCLCTNHGLVIFDLTSHDYITYDEGDGLPSNVTYASQIDKQGNIWVSGNAGLCCIEPKQGNITVFTTNDGIQSNEFYKNTTLKDYDGNLWFGGVAGLTMFDPGQISMNGQKCRARIIDFSVAGHSYHGKYDLPHEDNSPTIEIGTLPIMYTRTVSYRYSLDHGFWVTLPAGSNQVTFSHLQPGEHTFDYVCVFNGEESPIEHLVFTIASPWYVQWWAQLLWIALLMLILWMAYMQFAHRRKEHDQQIEHEQTQAINEAKLHFFMNISHEIRTPMTLIVSPLQKLINTDPDPQRQRSYELIQRNANRILGLINQLMDLRKIDQNQMKLYFSELEVVPYIRNICETVSDVADIRQIAVRLTDETQPGLRLWVDTTNFDKIIINLLTNSLKYTPKGGYIEVLMQQGKATAEMPDGSFIFTITDSGVGIPASERDHIFDRFYQVRGNNINGGGTGIGLNLTHSLVELHHGTIELTDNPEGQGTRFIICLPLGNRHLKLEEMSQDMPIITAPKHIEEVPEFTAVVLETKQEASATTTSSTRKTVMIVEDDKEIRDYVVREISDEYNAIECHDGQQAFDRIMHEAPDLIISDLMMPNMDGMTLCQKVRQNVRLNHIPFVMMTAKTQEQDRLQGLEVGADAYITKPFNIELLRQTVKNLLRSHDRLRNTFSGQQLPTNQIAKLESMSPDERLLARVNKVIGAHLNDPGLTTDLIAQEVGLSRVHLYRKLKELTNQSARDYVRNIRLAKAAELLAEKKVAVSEVSDLVGFSNPNNFATAFRELYGMTPTQYMEGHLK